MTQGTLAETERKKQQSQGQWERQEVERMEQRPWYEMRCLISPGQVRSYWWSVWSDAEPIGKKGHHQLHWAFIMAVHNGKGDSCSLWSICLLLTPPPLGYQYFPLFSSNSLSNTLWNLTYIYILCPEVSLRGTRFYFGPQLYLQMPGRFPFPLFQSMHSVQWKGIRLQTQNKSLWNENSPPAPLLDGNSMWLCLRLVYLWFFDHNSMRRCLIPGVLWQFACWQKALQCLKLDQRRHGLKSRRPAGRRSEKTQTLARAIVRYTVASGSHNFSLCMFFISLPSPSLIFCSECWMAQ